MAKALIIDDSRAIRLILTKTLSDLGFEVSQAANGQAALDLIQNENRDLSLILVDWNMPVMNGLEFVRHVRANPDLSGVPVMMVTTETETEQMVAALEAGANEYVMKPFTPDVIESKLRLIGAIS